MTANSRFALGNWPTPSHPHNGHIYEAIFYQTALNDAQRRIISSYISAKWSSSFSSSANYPDTYRGDDTVSGDYDFFVGGIGQDNGQQETGTSQGLTITDNSFLTADGKFLLAGVDYLVNTPTVGTNTLDIPSDYLTRSQRSWFIDSTGTGGTVHLAFDASKIGIPINNGEKFGPLHRIGTNGIFTEVATASMSSGQIVFTHLPADGVYAIGKLNNEVALSMSKTADTNTPNIGDTVTFSLTVNNAGPADATNASIIDAVPMGFGNLSELSSPAGSTFTATGNTIVWNGVNIPAGESVVAVFSAEVLPP